jgi:2-polyprenyl-3-methyl-5-hydroxy-6-metoxy-1,4-benzoquinol methylase
LKSLTANREDVVHAYRLLLGRDADPGELDHQAALIRDGNTSTIDLAHRFFSSREFVSRVGRLAGVAASKGPPEKLPHLSCQPCTRRRIDSPNFRYWASRMGLKPGGLHRKAWEWCFISQVLRERGALGPGHRGLGFAVGEEPLTSLFAGMGCEILATDLDVKRADQEGWVEGKQHASSLEQVNARGLCSPELFDANVRFRCVDMREIPNDLSGFDFIWSSCALEHLGSLRHGMDFVLNAMECLRPGGIAVHTTELNVESDTHTIETGHDVIYRKSDLLGLADELRARGHVVEPFDFDTGDSDADRHVDEPPYVGRVHLKLRICGFASTSYGIVVSRKPE